MPTSSPFRPAHAPRTGRWHHPPAAAPGAARFELLARRLEAALAPPTAAAGRAAGGASPPPPDPVDEPHLLIAVEATDDDVAVGFRPLHDHPFAELAGEIAPPSWTAVGLSVTGTARRVDDLGRPSCDPAARGERVHVVHLVDRSGASVAIVRAGAAEPIVHTADGTSPEHLGQLDDCLRRTLELPTAPPPAPTGAALMLAWLDRVLCAAARGDLAGAGWPDVRSLHPVFDPAAGLVVGERRARELARLATDDLAAASCELAHEVGWDELRDRAGRGHPWLVDVGADLARWMDVGMYARNVVYAFPDERDLLDTLAELVHEPLHARLVDAVAARDGTGDGPS